MRNWELRQALITTLRGHAGLAALLPEDPRFAGTPAVYDHVPQDTTFPYVVVAPMIGDEHDADDTTGQTLEVTVHTWSRERGFREVEQIGRQVDAALHRSTPTVTDARVITVHREDSQAVLDEDGLTRHGIQTFRVILEEE